MDVAYGDTKAGANVQQWYETGGDNQKWQFTKVDESHNTGSNTGSDTPVATAGFHTSGTTLYDAKNQPFVMRGIITLTSGIKAMRKLLFLLLQKLEPTVFVSLWEMGNNTAKLH